MSVNRLGIASSPVDARMMTWHHHNASPAMTLSGVYKGLTLASTTRPVWGNDANIKVCILSAMGVCGRQVTWEEPTRQRTWASLMPASRVLREACLQLHPGATRMVRASI